MINYSGFKTYSIGLILLLTCFSLNAGSIAVEDKIKVFLGIEIAPLSKEKAQKLGFANPYGSYVKRVIPRTSAEKAKLLPFDYIYGIDEYRVNEDRKLGYILSQFYIGDKATIYLIRKGKQMQLPVVFIKSENTYTIEEDKCKSPFFGIEPNHSAPTSQGIRISVISNSTAKAIGVTNKDIILQINGHSMIDWVDISTAIDAMKVGQVIKVKYVRNGVACYAEGPIKSFCDTKLFQSAQPKASITGQNQWNPKKMVSVSIAQPSTTEVQRINRNTDLALPLRNTLELIKLEVNTQSPEGTFPMRFQLSKSSPIVVRIYNASGRIVYDYELKAFNGSFEDAIDISENGKGDYYLVIKQETKANLQRITLS